MFVSNIGSVKNYNIHPNSKLSIDNILNKGLRSQKNRRFFLQTPQKNEGFEANKEKILFFMSIDYPEIPEYGTLTIKYIKDYCEKHNYTFKLFNHNKKNSISPYWIRVKDLKEQLDSNDYSTIIYFDLDVIINPNFMNTKIDYLINNINKQSNKNWDMYLATDPHYNNYEMNTGIIIVKNTEWSKQFVNLWYNNYPQDFWKKQNSGKWECYKDNGFFSNSCLWAGDEYEQGMMNRLYQRNVLNCKKHIIPVSYKIFGNKKISNNSFIYHFMGYSNKDRVNNIRKLYKTKPELQQTKNLILAKPELQTKNLILAKPELNVQETKIF